MITYSPPVSITLASCTSSLSIHPKCRPWISVMAPMLTEDLFRPDPRMDLWSILEVYSSTSSTRRTSSISIRSMVMTTRVHALDLQWIAWMIMPLNLKQACSSRTSPLWVQTCKQNLNKLCKKNAMQGYSPYSLVKQICQIGSSLPFRPPTLPSKKESLLSKPNKMSLLICRLRLIRRKLQHPLL